MDAADRKSESFATRDQVRAAIEALSVEDLARLRRASAAFRYGTEYTDPLELMNEAVARAMAGAGEEKGRHWPLHVPFVGFLIMTMSSIADTSANSPVQHRTDALADFVPEGMAYHDFAPQALRAPSTEEACADEKEEAAAAAKAAATFTAIETHFENDEEVLMVLLCLREGYRPRQIQQEAGMTKTQYETVRKRLRRGLNQLGFAGPQP